MTGVQTCALSIWCIDGCREPAGLARNGWGVNDGLDAVGVSGGDGDSPIGDETAFEVGVVSRIASITSAKGTCGLCFSQRSATKVERDAPSS